MMKLTPEEKKVICDFFELFFQKWASPRRKSDTRGGTESRKAGEQNDSGYTLE